VPPTSAVHPLGAPRPRGSGGATMLDAVYLGLLATLYLASVWIVRAVDRR